MNELLLLIAQNGLLLLAGTTLLLSLGCGAVLLCKSPVHRQRVSELTIAGAMVWMVLALFPLPRLLPEKWNAEPPAAEATLPLELVPMPIPEADLLPVGRPSQAVLDENTDGQGSPSYVANEPSTLANESSTRSTVPSLDSSPSEEIASQSSQIPLPANRSEGVATTAPVWQFDFQKLAGLATGLYLAGASLCLFWILAGYILLFRIRQTAAIPPAWLADQYQELARQAGLAPPRLIVSRQCGRPLTWGMFWPVIVLPHSLCRQENKSQVTTILLHELGHIVQQDARGNFLFCLALPLLYAHPLYWWLRRDSQLAAELVADDWAAWQTGKETYVEELVALARCTGTSSLPLVGVTGLFSSPSQFYRRMSMLLAREKRLSTKTSLPWRLASLSALAGTVALAASLAGVRPVAGQTAPPALTPPATAAADDPATPGPPAAPKTPPAVPLNPPVGLSKPVPATAGGIDPAGLPKAHAPAATPSPVSADEAALLAEINELQEKLRTLEAKRNPDKPSIGIQNLSINPGTKTIAITRIDGEGMIWNELWSMDEKGQPTKMISKSSMAKIPALATPAKRVAISSDGSTLFHEIVDKDGYRWIHVYDAKTGTILEARKIYSKPAQNSVPSFDVIPDGAEKRAATSRDGKTLMREFTNPDGSRVSQIVDASTGKVIAENRTGGVSPPKRNREPDDVLPGDTKVGTPIGLPRATNAEYPIPTLRGQTNPLPNHQKVLVPMVVPNAPAVVYKRPTTGQPASASNFANGPQQLDLVSLAISYTDAISEREAATVKLSDVSRLRDSKVISQQEFEVAQLALSAAERKEKLLRSIAQVALDSAVEEVEIAKSMRDAGRATLSAATDAKARLSILKQILGTTGETKNATDKRP